MVSRVPKTNGRGCWWGSWVSEVAVTDVNSATAGANRIDVSGLAGRVDDEAWGAWV